MNTALVEPWPLFNCNLFFIKDAVKVSEAKTADKLDVFDPKTRELLLECREPDLGGLTKLRRFAGGRHDVGSPFNLVASIPGNPQQILRVAREGAAPFTSPMVEFYDHENRPILTMKKKFFAIGRKYLFYAPERTLLFEMHAKFKFGGCRLMVGKKELGTLVAKWKGDEADYFKQGFAYALSINEEVPNDSVHRQLLLGLALAFHRVQI